MNERNLSYRIANNLYKHSCPQGSKVLTPEAWSVGCAEHGKGGKKGETMVDKPKEHYLSQVIKINIIGNRENRSCILLIGCNENKAALEKFLSKMHILNFVSEGPRLSDVHKTMGLDTCT